MSGDRCRGGRRGFSPGGLRRLGARGAGHGRRGVARVGGQQVQHGNADDDAEDDDHGGDDAEEDQGRALLLLTAVSAGLERIRRLRRREAAGRGGRLRCRRRGERRPRWRWPRRRWPGRSDPGTGVELPRGADIGRLTGRHHQGGGASPWAAAPAPAAVEAGDVGDGAGGDICAPGGVDCWGGLGEAIGGPAGGGPAAPTLTAGAMATPWPPCWSSSRADCSSKIIVDWALTASSTSPVSSICVG